MSGSIVVKKEAEEICVEVHSFHEDIDYEFTTEEEVQEGIQRQQLQYGALIDGVIAPLVREQLEGFSGRYPEHFNISVPGVFVEVATLSWDDFPKEGSLGLGISHARVYVSLKGAPQESVREAFSRTLRHQIKSMNDDKFSDLIDEKMRWTN
ncbi:MAG: hypothetical protein OEY66_08120 [Gammaproteobacteria bacterium]|nr:hypothetical protein [Gammaproteobacteria bacterium]